jgi:LysM repeat protein
MSRIAVTLFLLLSFAPGRVLAFAPDHAKDTTTNTTTTSTAKDTVGCRLYYVVRPGDTLGMIAQNMRMLPVQRSAKKIAEINNIEKTDVISVGSKLCVDEKILNTASPVLECYKTGSREKICMDSDMFESAKDVDLSAKSKKRKSSKCGSFHTVKSGESLSRIASKLGMHPPYDYALRMAETSGIENPNLVEAGDKICVDENLLAPDPVVGDKSVCFTTKKERKICTTEDVIREIQGKKASEQEVVEAEPAKQKPQPPIEEPKKDEPKQKKAKQEEPEEEDTNGETEVLTGFVIAPFLSYSRIDAVDRSNNAKGAILSKADFGAEFKIMQLWGDSFTSEIFIQAERRNYSTRSGRTFTQHGGEMVNFGAGLGFRPFRRLEVKLRAMYGDEFYFRAPSLTSLAIDDTKTLKGDIALYFDIMTARYASTGLGGGARIIRSGYIDGTGGVSYNAKLGYGYFGTFYMRHKFSHIILEESFTYEELIKNTDLFDQKHMAAYMKVGLYLLF